MSASATISPRYHGEPARLTATHMHVHIRHDIPRRPRCHGGYQSQVCRGAAGSPPSHASAMITSAASLHCLMMCCCTCMRRSYVHLEVLGQLFARLRPAAAAHARCSWPQIRFHTPVPNLSSTHRPALFLPSCWRGSGSHRLSPVCVTKECTNYGQQAGANDLLSPVSTSASANVYVPRVHCCSCI